MTRRWLDDLREGPFIVRVLNGVTPLEAIDDEVDRWHSTKDPEPTDTLCHFLGMTETEYVLWVKDPKNLTVIINERRYRKNNRRVTVYGDWINPNQGEGRYQDTLRRLRALIAGGSQLFYDDDTTMGNKSTVVSWGLCDDSLDVYPEKNDHTFPNQFPGRSSPRNQPEKAYCPMDRLADAPPEIQAKQENSGCFYRCRVFKPGEMVPGKPNPKNGKVFHRLRSGSVPTREQALKRYDDLIAKRELVFGKKVTADDGESLWW